MRTLLALAVALCFPAAAFADAPPPGATWTQATIKEADGTRLHADVLRPAGLPADARTPVILSIGPYFNHSGQTGPAGPVEGTPYTPTGEAGPSARFYDFIEGAKLMERGYTWVQVDLRGFGGSTGCLDWGGPGEQADAKAAVEWAAAQPWSTGKVGMYGKSYDGATGLMGIAQQPAGLAAVVSQEPVYDLYRYLYTNRVRFTNSLATPLLYDAIAGTPGTTGDTLAYNADSLNDVARPGCPALNWLDQQSSDHGSAYWRARDYIAATKGKTTPLFLTQGFIEDNTKPDGTWDLYNGLAGPKRAWFGMWDHVRGNDADASGRLLMGRHGWFDEVMRFFDRYVKGAQVADDPPVAVESSDGTWRAEDAWPPADSAPAGITLNRGSYTDDGQNDGTGSGAGTGIWTISKPLAAGAHLAGVPKLSVDVASAPSRANLVADVYDIDAGNQATLISRGADLLNGAGSTTFDLYGDDWKLPAGHRVGVLLTSANAEWWLHVPTLGTVDVAAARIELPFLRCTRTATIEGGPSVKLDSYRAEAPFAVGADTVAAAERADFEVPATSAC
ncbi:CocE/NonD family hydrolase [Candidatus Solirubrobacter pratensis]|uniref:CocE/NonD family hydrolase n=1 Tax=Candidatus Solirubrobacter pratensis TaxID=1298857 RepID=UPI000418A191|nr:CocE/NonD family hydrolase [Candidatus Solirubrobacter pratensis]